MKKMFQEKICLKIIRYSTKHLNLFVNIIEQLILKINYIYLPLVLLQHHSFTSFLRKNLAGQSFYVLYKDITQQ